MVIGSKMPSPYTPGACCVCTCRRLSARLIEKEKLMTAKKILWVEDDRDILDAGLPFLKQEGWDVSTVASAIEGKELVSANKPDLIIMDIIMPGEHGFNAVEDLKNQPGMLDVPIIIFTSVTHRWGETTATREDGLLTNADFFVDKSEGVTPLVEAVRKYLHV